MEPIVEMSSYSWIFSALYSALVVVVCYQIIFDVALLRLRFHGTWRQRLFDLICSPWIIPWHLYRVARGKAQLIEGEVS